jgi:hypothetical protein
MTRYLRGRLDRLEKAQPDTENGSARFSHVFTKALLAPETLTRDEREELALMMKMAEVDCARAAEASNAGRLYRQELARLALPRPNSLAGIDVIEECIRLAGLPSPNANGPIIQQPTRIQ